MIFRALPVLLAASLLTLTTSRAEVKITPKQDVVHVEIDGKPFTSFVMRGGGTMKPFLHPLRTADGKIVTRLYPMEKLEGEPTDHPHHRGLWFAHEKVNGFDFWNNEESYTNKPHRGRIEVAKIDEAKGGADAGVIKATMHWLDPNGTKLVEESRTMTFRGDAKLRIVDLDITLTAATKVTFGDSKDGVLGVRVAAPLNEIPPKGKEGGTIPNTGKLTNAEGQSGEKAVWGKTSDWMDYAGTIDGQPVGIAILDHPENSPRARWHVRGYGLFAANPFGLAVFTGDKSKSGSIDLEPGKKIQLRYRVIVHPGDTAAADLPKLWRDYIAKAK